MKSLVLFVLILSLPVTTLAAPPAVAPELLAIFASASEKMDIPQALALAIARQESKYHLWAVNIAGKSYFPASREEALHLIHDARRQGKSHDIGIMQVNSWWLKRLGLQPEQVIDPQNNILLGSMILSQEIKRHGLNWRAVASYHTPLSRNPERGRRYAASVVAHLKAMGG